MKIIIGMIFSSEIDENNPVMERKLVRKTQIAEGIEQFMKYKAIFNKYQCTVDYLISDNTCTEIDPIITSVIPKDFKVICGHYNHFGNYNKGAGLLEHWTHLMPILSNYDWFINYEPRSLIIDDSFMVDFLNNPTNLFATRGDVLNAVTPNLCVMRVSDMRAFCDAHAPHKLGSNSIEYILFEFFKDKSRFVPKCHIIWHNSVTKKDIYF